MNLTRFAFTFAGCLAVVYAVGVLCSWDWNPGNWRPEWRAFLILTAGIGSGLSSMKDPAP